MQLLLAFDSGICATVQAAGVKGPLHVQLYVEQGGQERLFLLEDIPGWIRLELAAYRNMGVTIPQGQILTGW